MNRCAKPESTLADMRNRAQEPDRRLEIIVELLRYAPLEKLQTILDIGMGRGQIAEFLANIGKSVIGTGLEFAAYGLDAESLKNKFAIEIVEAVAETLPFKSAMFDAVVMSHVLEHCPNVGLALQEVHRILKDRGYLFLFVPPTEDIVCAGHVSVGWNIGQLMYVLLLNGFDVKAGQFVQYGYNVCAFVQKSLVQLPPLHGDKGDIYTLASQGLFPLPIISRDGTGDHFFGKLRTVNWKYDFPYGQMNPVRQVLRKIKSVAHRVIVFLPFRLRHHLGLFLMKTAEIISDEGRMIANPKLSQVVNGDTENPNVLSD